MSVSMEETADFARTFAALVDTVSVALLDKAHPIRLALTTMFAGGHLLLEDAPGTGKTALARAIRPGGQLRLGTDIASYAAEMLLAVRREGSFSWDAEGPSDWRDRPADWPQTRYEAKARREGRAPTYLLLTRKPVPRVSAQR